MGIPTAAFQAGNLYIEYPFEEVLFRYEKKTGRFYCKFYSDSREDEVPHDSGLVAEARTSGVLTTAERYDSGGAPVADPAAGSFSRLAIKHQRIRPYWLSVMHRKDYARSGDIEVGNSGRLEVVEAAGSARELLEKAVSDINAQPCLTVTWGNDAPIAVARESRDHDLALRLELKRLELTIVAESSFYRGRSEL